MGVFQRLKDFLFGGERTKASPEDHVQRGLAKFSLEDYQGAEREWNMAIALDPEHALAYYNRGLLYEYQNKPQAAIEDFLLAHKLFTEQNDTKHTKLIDEKLKQVGK